jgi:hypothetical protein
MKSYRDQESVPYGLYLSTQPLDVRFVGADGELLQGRPEASYSRLPILAVLVAGPVLGGAFVLAFPIVILVTLTAAFGQLAARWLRGLFHEQVPVVRARWAPAAAYLNDTEAATGDPEAEADEDSELEDLEAEVEAAREHEQRTDEA